MPDVNEVQAAATHDMYIRNRNTAVFRNYKLGGILDAKGRTKLRSHGVQLTWTLEYQRGTLRNDSDMQPRVFAKQQRNVRLSLPWLSKYVPRFVSRNDWLANRNSESQIMNLWKQNTESVMEDLKEQFIPELYKNADTAGNLAGFESFLGNSGAAATGYIATPSDTYAGISTALADKGGTWSTDSSGNVKWPRGRGSYSYDYASPLIIDTTDTAWGSSPSFLNYGYEQLLFAINRMNRFGKLDDKLDLFVLTDDTWDDLQRILIDKEGLYIVPGQDRSLLTKLGYGDLIQINGVDITYEYGMDVGDSTVQFYGLNVDKITLHSQEDVMFKGIGPREDIFYDGWQMAADYHGNMEVVSPRFFVKGLPVT